MVAKGDVRVPLRFENVSSRFGVQFRELFLQLLQRGRVAKMALQDTGDLAPTPCCVREQGDEDAGEYEKLEQTAMRMHAPASQVQRPEFRPRRAEATIIARLRCPKCSGDSPPA